MRLKVLERHTPFTVWWAIYSIADRWIGGVSGKFRTLDDATAHAAAISRRVGNNKYAVVRGSKLAAPHDRGPFFYRNGQNVSSLR